MVPGRVSSSAAVASSSVVPQVAMLPATRITSGGNGSGGSTGDPSEPPQPASQAASEKAAIIDFHPWACGITNPPTGAVACEQRAPLHATPVLAFYRSP